MLLKDQFLVTEVDIKKREEFYNEMYALGYRDNLYHKSKETIINNQFPFLIEPKNKTITVLESITCCAIAQQNKLIIAIETFERMNFNNIE